MATKPPVAYYSNFSNYNIPLYVPAESIEAYRYATDWKNFTNILALDNAGVDDITQDDGEAVTVYNLQGVRFPITTRKDLNRLPHGVYIVNGVKIKL